MQELIKAPEGFKYEVVDDTTVRLVKEETTVRGYTYFLSINNNLVRKWSNYSLDKLEKIDIKDPQCDFYQHREELPRVITVPKGDFLYE
jgi:hypothetical protein